MASEAYVEKQWTTQTGLTAAVLATSMGHRCGYVQIPNHMLGLTYDEVDERLEDYVHGGLTFAGKPMYCDFHAVGFDCSHSGDAKDPDLIADEYKKIEAIYDGGTIRTLQYCIDECEKLASMLLK